MDGEMPEDVRRLCGDHLVEVDHVADLANVFDRVRLTLAPIAAGAAVEAKVLDSLAAGVPCICTSIAAEGLALPQTLKSCIADGATALADAVSHFHRNQAANKAVARAGLDYIAAEFSDHRLDEGMRKVIGTRYMPSAELA